MKTRKNLRAELNTLYKDKVISWLSESVNSKNKFIPVRIYLGAPASDEDMLTRKDEFLKFCEEWHGDLIAGKVEFIEKTYPQIGKIEVPVHIVFESVDEIATMAGHLVEYHIALSRLTLLKNKLPELLESGIRHINYLTSLDDADFERFVNVCRWLCKNRDSGAFIRQIPVRGVDTIWFEKYRVLILSFLRDLFDLNPIRKDVFQLGLVPPPSHIRLELIDANIRSMVGNLRDVSIPFKDLCLLNIKPAKVYLVDDLATALSFPDVNDAILIYLSSHVAEVCKIPFVASADEIYYVSGVEFRSFALLNNLRVYLPKTKSVTLNRNFFTANKDLWSFDDIEISELNPSMALNAEESILYNMLAAGFFGKGARLPLERISLTSVFEVLDISTADLPYKPLEDDESSNFIKAEETEDSESPETYVEQSSEAVNVRDDKAETKVESSFDKVDDDPFSTKEEPNMPSQESDWALNNPLKQDDESLNDDLVEKNEKASDIKDNTESLGTTIKIENNSMSFSNASRIQSTFDYRPGDDISQGIDIHSNNPNPFADVREKIESSPDSKKEKQNTAKEKNEPENKTYIIDILKNNFDDSEKKN